MPISASDTVQLTLIQAQQGVRTANVLYVQPNAAIADEQIDATIQTLVTTIWPEFSAIMSRENVLRAVVMRVPTDLREPTRAYSFNDEGQLPGDALPSASCYVLRHYSLPSSRRSQGRYFIGGVAESVVKEACVTDTGVLAMGPFINSLTATGWTSGGFVFRGRHVSRLTGQYFDIEKANIDPTIRQLASRQTDVLTFS